MLHSDNKEKGYRILWELLIPSVQDIAKIAKKIENKTEEMLWQTAIRSSMSFA